MNIKYTKESSKKLLTNKSSENNLAGMENIRLAIVFPGKITKFNGLGELFFKSYPEVERIFTDMNISFGSELVYSCIDGFDYTNDSETKKILSSHILSCLFANILRYYNITPKALLGSSLGIYATLFAAKSISFDESNYLIKSLIDSISQNSDYSNPAYADILGLDEKTLVSLIENFKPGTSLLISHFNTQNHFIVSGDEQQLLKLIELSKKVDGLCQLFTKADYLIHTNFIKLSPLWYETLNNINFADPDIQVFCDTEAKPFNSVQEIKTILPEHIRKPVFFERSIRALISDGINSFIEVGGGGALSKQIRWIDRKVRIHCIEDKDSFEKAIKLLK